MDPNGREFAESKYQEGRNLLDNGEYAKGQKGFEASLPIFEEHSLKSQRADTIYNLIEADLKSNLAKWFFSIGNNKVAEKYFKEAHKIYMENQLGPDNIKVINCQNGLSRCLGALGAEMENVSRMTGY